MQDLERIDPNLEWATFGTEYAGPSTHSAQELPCARRAGKFQLADSFPPRSVFDLQQELIRGAGRLRLAHEGCGQPPKREQESQNENADPQTQQAPSHHAAFAEWGCSAWN